MVLKNITYAPGLYKIFDEIIVNAADNKVRDSTMDTIKVDINVEKNLIKVLNTGAGIPVEMHKTEGVYVPELIFGHLLTSSNYNDKEKKVTGGRNGYGAKLANIFSTKFVIETCDGKRKLRYKQTFSKNMSKKGEPIITECASTDNWTSITFSPDLERFSMHELEAETVELMRKRVYDLAGILGKSVNVYLNGTKLPVKDFKSYVDLYLGKATAEGAVPRTYEKVGDRWEICVATSEGQFNQVSFVNSICTSKGGTHVNHIADQVVKHLCDGLSKKHKQANVKPFMVKNYLWVFVNCLIENPAFDSQTKDTLTLRASAFGSKCELSETYLKKVSASGVTDLILNFANFKANKELKKTDGAKRQRLLGIPKLDDANDAGGRNSEHCTLILTEGDSAKSLAISGLSVVGRDRFGVFPLRGKLLNVRDASAAQINANAEINNIKQILGLQHGKVYTDTKSLRYGHLMIMTDQDHDGSHIKGLIMNFLHTFYPSLLKIPGFLVEFITPIIKATKGKESITFYTLPEYENWRDEVAPRGWNIKYYKGLGTSTATEAKQYFADIDCHRKEFVYMNEEDDKALVMAFSKKSVEDRKEWLRNYMPGTFLDHSADVISYHEFVHKELILFSRADLERSIPSVVDGLKPGQRKILYACFKRNLKNDIKVAQLSGYVAEHSAYHHGETSLATTIVGLAQDFVGSNNINILVPQGQFGTRIQGGKDAASARYIFTRIAPLTRHLFNEHDDRLLNYLNEEGQRIEPEWYMPIVPAVLINGAEGIGTGWSTSIPNFNPRDIVTNLLRLLDGEAAEPMAPWYRGFNGEIVEVPTRTAGRSYQVTGIINQIDDTTLEISELPVRKWTQDYKEFLEDLVKPEDKNAQPLITEYKEHHTDVTVKFLVTLTEEKMREVLAAGLHNKFKLTSKISCSNMMLFGPDGIIKKYDTPEDILTEFFHLRLQYYGKRRAALLKAAESDMQRIDNKVRFILAVVNGELVISNRRRVDIEAELEEAGYDRLLAKTKNPAAQPTPSNGEEAVDGEEVVVEGGSYEYLLSMSLSSLTHEKVESLRAEAEEQRAAVELLRNTTEQQMWRHDLEEFLEMYDEYEDEAARNEVRMARQQARARAANAKKQAKVVNKGKKKKGRNEWSDSEDEFSESGSDGSLSDGDDVVLPIRAKKVAPAPRPAAKATVSKATSTSSMSVSQVSSGAPVAAKKAPPKPAAAAPPPLQPPVEEEMSLMARMAMRMGGLNIENNNKAAVAGPEPSSSSVSAAASARPGRAAAVAAGKKTATVVMDDDDDVSDVDIMDNDEEASMMSAPVPVPAPSAVVAKKTVPAKKAAPAAAAKPKKQPVKKVVESDSDNDDEKEEEVMVVAAPKAAPARARVGRAAAPVKYVDDDSEEEEEEESSDDAEDDYCPSD